jgi:hypothetical protein
MTAELRSVQTRMWREDEWFQSLPTDARLLFIYLFTNPSASVSGIYRLPLRTIEFESGIPGKRVKELLAEFSAANKVHFEDGVVWVVKMRENQIPGKVVGTVQTRIDKDVATIPDGRVKRAYLAKYTQGIEDAIYPIDTLSIPVATDTETDTDTVTSRPTGISPSKPTPKPATTQQEMFGAVAETCELDPQLKRGVIAKTAKDLLAAKYTPDMVRGFKAWWLADAWRAEHTPVPSLAKLLEKLPQYRNMVEQGAMLAPTNGVVAGFVYNEAIGD